MDKVLETALIPLIFRILHCEAKQENKVVIQMQLVFVVF
jgi:hypothetical protein